MIWKVILTIPTLVISCVAKHPGVHYISLPDSLQQVTLTGKGYAYSVAASDTVFLHRNGSQSGLYMPGGHYNIKYDAGRNLIYGYNSYYTHIYSLDSSKLIHATTGRMGGLVNQWADELSHYAILGRGSPSRNFLIKHGFYTDKKIHIPLPKKYFRNFWVLNMGMVALADNKAKEGITYGLNILPQNLNSRLEEVFVLDRKKSEQEERPIFFSLFAADSSQNVILNANPVTEKIDVYQFKDRTKKTLEIKTPGTKWIHLEKNRFYWHDADSNLVKSGLVEGTQVKDICTLGQSDSTASQFTTNTIQIGWLEEIGNKKRLAAVSKKCPTP